MRGSVAYMGVFTVNICEKGCIGCCFFVAVVGSFFFLFDFACVDCVLNFFALLVIKVIQDTVF